MRAREFTEPQAAGCIIRAADTGRWCLQQRSESVSDPGVWSTWGGGRESGETLEQTVRRELAEEGGYTGPLKLEPLLMNRRYATYIGHVPHEFEPRLNSESQDSCWVEAGDWPEPLHPGLARALDKISNGVTEAQSAKTGIYQTDVFGAKAYHAKCMEPNCDWESKRYDRIKQAQAAAEKHAKSHFKQGVAEGLSNDMSTEDIIAYLRQHHDKNLHPDYLDHLTSTNSKFVLKNIPLNSIRTELAGLDRAKVEQYKRMDFSKAPPIVVGSDGNILDGYHRATVAKALGIPTIKAYVGVKGQQGLTEGKQPGKSVVDAILRVMPVAQEIWFHGSRATGKHRRNSDTDILVVVPDNLVGDKYLSAVRILQKLNSHFDNYDIQPTKTGTNIHRIAQEEGRLLWPKQGVAEGSMKDLHIDLQDQQWDAIVGYVITGLKKNMDIGRMELNLYKYAGQEMFDVDQELQDRGFKDIADLANHIKQHNGKYVPPTDFDLGKGVAEGSLNEASSDEAWELVGQPVPEIQQFVKQMGYGNDKQSVAKITAIIDKAASTQIPAASIPKLKNLANKGSDIQTLKAVQQISGRPDAEQQYTKLMQARDAGEGRRRDVSGYLQYVKSGNYDPPVLLKLPTGIYVIGGRTRLYAALALGVPANVKIISANSFKQAVAEGLLAEETLDDYLLSLKNSGAKLLGRGNNAMVFTNPEDDRTVIKVMHQPDPAYMAYLRQSNKHPNNPWLPRVLDVTSQAFDTANPRSGTTAWIIVLEKLRPASAAEVKNAVDTVLATVDPRYLGRQPVDAYRTFDDIKKLWPIIAQHSSDTDIQVVAKFLSQFAPQDIDVSRSNVMMRGSQLVFADPVLS